MSTISNSNMHALKKICYALLLLRRGGLGILLRQFQLRLCSRTTYVWLAKDLDSTPLHSPLIHYTLQPATPETFKYLLDDLNKESGQDVFEILRRVSFYKNGFDTCFLAFTDSGEICHMSWLLTPSQNELIQSRYPPKMHNLQEGEVLEENIFTFPRFRRKGVMTSVTIDLANMARSLGYRRMLAYVDIKNKPSLSAYKRLGFRSYDGEQEIRRFFRIRRRKDGSCSRAFQG